MVRQLLVPVLLAVLAVPDSAIAQPCVPCPPPVVVYGPPIGCVPTAGTVAPAQAKPPTVVPERMEPQKKPQVTADPPKMMPAKAEEPAAPQPGPLPPVKAEEVKPAPLPVMTIPDPKPVAPQSEPKQVVPPVGNDRIPAPAVPPGPPARQDLPPLDIPPIGGEASPAKPQPAESTPVKPEPVKPAEPKAADKPKEPEGLKPLDIPLPKPDPSGVAQPVEANKTSVSKSSPLTDMPCEVDVYPKDAAKVVPAMRGVTFVNKSARDILLTVNGQTTTLPSKTVLAVELPAAFKWQIGGEAERSEKVPDGSPGVDVVIRK